MLIFAKNKKIIISAGLIAMVTAGLACGNDFCFAESVEVNKSYLEYLNLPDEEKAKVDLIPDMYKIKADDVIRKMAGANRKGTSGIRSFVSDDELPAYYDLRDVNGNSYVTPLKDQGNLGICWALTTMEQAESLVMVSSDTPYDENTVELSSRQIDYASSNDGIKDYNNENGMRNLLQGGNFYISSLVGMNGLTLVPESVMPFDESSAKKELADVLNYGNSMYEIESTLMMPDLGPYLISLYVETTKSLVMEYGGAYLATGSPQGSCAARNTDGTYVIQQDEDCLYDSNFGGHAMQIIGWDDNYEYKYCKVGSRHSAAIGGSCSSGSLVSGTGAWIVRNSWGEDSRYAYVYLAFDSEEMDTFFITGLSTMEDRQWDNNYHHNAFENDVTGYSTRETSEFTKKISGAEKVDKIKFLTLGIGQTYTVSISSESTNYGDVASNFDVLMPGIYTLDLTDSNIIIEDDSFTVTVRSSGGQIVENTIAVFTENIDETPMMTTTTITTEEDILENGDFSTVLYSDTKNIPSNTIIEYKLMKGDVDYSDYLSVTNNVIAANNIRPTITIDEALNYGEYTIVASYGGETFEFPLNLRTSFQVDFDTEDGTVEMKGGDIIIFTGNDYNDLLDFVTVNTADPIFLHYDQGTTLTDNTTLKTGDTIEIKKNDKIKNIYRIVILGDITGDGDITSGDYIKIRKHIMETETIDDGSIQYYAADVDKNNMITSGDYIKIRKYIMEKEM